MNDREKAEFLDQLNDIQGQASQELFEVGKPGTSETAQALLDQISKLRDKISLVGLEHDLIKMMRGHNRKVDEFTRKFDSGDYEIFEEAAKLDLFEDKVTAALPGSHHDEVKRARNYNLDQKSSDIASEYKEDHYEMIRTIMEKHKHTLSKEEAAHYLSEYNDYLYAAEKSRKTAVDVNSRKVRAIMDKFQRDVMVSKRLGLDYGRLFKNEQGGYDLGTLKTALERL